jgi:hypothetical protein
MWGLRKYCQGAPTAVDFKVLEEVAWYTGHLSEDLVDLWCKVEIKRDLCAPKSCLA